MAVITKPRNCGIVGFSKRKAKHDTQILTFAALPSEYALDISERTCASDMGKLDVYMHALREPKRAPAAKGAMRETRVGGRP